MLKQRIWVIMIRPYETESDTEMYYTGVPKASPGDFGQSGTGTVNLKGNNEGQPSNSTIETTDGGWVDWFTTTSYPKLRMKYREALQTIPSQHVRVAEINPMDMEATPKS